MTSTKRIGSICEILNGFAFKSEEYVQEGIRVMRITNVQKGQVVDDDPKYFPLHRKHEIERFILKEGDLLMSLTGNVGRVGLLPKVFLPAALNQRVACLRIKDSGAITIGYLFHALNSNGFEKDCIFNASGIAQKNMSTRWLEDYRIPVPTITEQENIVAELNLLLGILDKQNSQLKELDTLEQSLFYKMFGTTLEEKGWEVKTLGEVGTFQRGGGFLKSDYVDNGFPCIHYGQIHTRLGIATYNHLTSIPENLARTKSKLAETGDVIIAITSEDVEGSCKCTAWMGDYPVAVGGHAAIFRHSLNPIYAAYSFKSDYFQKAKEKYAHGFKVVEIKPSDIASISICIPPKALQDKFAEGIISIEQQKDSINLSIAETQKLFDQTMDKYFG